MRLGLGAEAMEEEGADLVAAQPFESRADGDASLERKQSRRVDGQPELRRAGQHHIEDLGHVAIELGHGTELRQSVGGSPAAERRRRQGQSLGRRPVVDAASR